jgi:hypothetical protein
VRHLAALAAVVVVAGCGGDDEPARTLSPGTLTLGFVVQSPRDREVEQAGRIAAAEVNDAGGIEGEVRLELMSGPDAGTLAAAGAGVIVLPCDPDAEQSAVAAVRGRRVLTLATCASTAEPRDSRLTTPWGVGPDLAARTALLAEVLRDRDVDSVRVEVAEARAVVTAALEKHDVDVVAEPGDALMTDGGWPEVALLAEPVYGFERLDSVAGAMRAGAAAPGGTAFVTFAYPSPGNEVDELYEKHRLEYGRRPDGSHVVLGYNAVRVAVEAVERWDTLDPAGLADAMPGLTVGGATGLLRYDEEGSRRPSAEAAVVEWRGGRFELVERGRPEVD